MKKKINKKNEHTHTVFFNSLSFLVSHSTRDNCSVVLWGAETSSVDGPFFCSDQLLSGRAASVGEEGWEGRRDRARRGGNEAGMEMMLTMRTFIKSSLINMFITF